MDWVGGMLGSRHRRGKAAALHLQSISTVIIAELEHIDTIYSFALREIVVILASEKTISVSTDNPFNISALRSAV